ncbi:MAG: hotdog fold thioesterase [Myxococcales bacterium]|nr:hotdog fold thioesterase [Myxococcales bacterium]
MSTMTARSLPPLAPAAAELIRRFMTDEIPFNRMLGIEVTGVAEGFIRLELPFRPELVGDPTRPALHGGVLAALIDAAGGGAAFTLIRPTDRISTIDMRVDYLRRAEPRRLICEATVARMGNRVASVDARVFHTDGAESVATGKAVYSIRRTREP